MNYTINSELMSGHKEPRQKERRKRKGGKTLCDRWTVKGRVYLFSFVFVKEGIIVAYLFCTEKHEGEFFTITTNDVM